MESCACCYFALLLPAVIGFGKLFLLLFLLLQTFHEGASEFGPGKPESSNVLLISCFFMVVVKFFVTLVLPSLECGRCSGSPTKPHPTVRTLKALGTFYSFNLRWTCPLREVTTNGTSPCYTVKANGVESHETVAVHRAVAETMREWTGITRSHVKGEVRRAS